MKTLVSGLKRREEITKSWLIVKLFFKLLLLLLLLLLQTIAKNYLESVIGLVICFPRVMSLKHYYYYYYYLRKKNRLHNPVYKITKDVCHNLWRAQIALIHYARGPAE